jgi:hypothetical protein
MEQTHLKKTLVIFAAIHAAVFLGLLPALAQAYYPGTGALENFFAQQMLNGQIPYHNFTSEYPPLALLSFLLPGILTANTVAYTWAFAAELLIFDLLAMLMLSDLARTFNP